MLRIGGSSEQVSKITLAFHLLLERLIVYFIACCLWAAPFPTLPLEVLVFSGLETSKGFHVTLLIFILSPPIAHNVRNYMDFEAKHVEGE